MDTFKKLSEVKLPDSRSKSFSVFDENSGQFRPKTLEDHHAAISNITLHHYVPEEIREHFETTKNLLLYSWFVYRFIPAAEFHACATLEYALKYKTNEEITGLRSLIEHAISQGWVKNENFSVWQKRKRMHNEQEKIYKELNEMMQQETKFQKYDFDYLEILKESIPNIRNKYAHGSNILYPGGYGRLKICSEFINQLFDESN